MTLKQALLARERSLIYAEERFYAVLSKAAGPVYISIQVFVYAKVEIGSL